MTTPRTVGIVQKRPGACRSSYEIPRQLESQRLRHPPAWSNCPLTLHPSRLAQPELQSLIGTLLVPRSSPDSTDQLAGDNLPWRLRICARHKTFLDGHGRSKTKRSGGIALPGERNYITANPLLSPATLVEKLKSCRLVRQENFNRTHLGG